ncbi:MAG: S1 RNA-binding domain-containing protein [Opitutales bacterium]|nr:S1 RNA-binding domain-containing protein [Opitutales bacterium]
MDGYMHKIGVDSAPNKPEIRYTQGKLESLGDHLCITERNSVDAERESVKTKLLEFFERQIAKDAKQSFRAIISDVKNHGLMIELTESLAFGMIHISTLDDDFYHPTEDGTALVGRRKKNTYTLGQYIQVQVERVDRFKRQIDFRVIPSTETKSAAGKSPKDLNALRKERRAKRAQSGAPKAVKQDRPKKTDSKTTAKKRPTKQRPAKSNQPEASAERPKKSAKPFRPKRNK